MVARVVTRTIFAARRGGLRQTGLLGAQVGAEPVRLKLVPSFRCCPRAFQPTARLAESGLTRVAFGMPSSLFSQACYLLLLCAALLSLQVSGLARFSLREAVLFAVTR
jgi:hypothetical protein